jgi:hypothetical protein
MKYYWDKWEAEAIAKGICHPLAALGRQVMRDYYQHGKEDCFLGEESDGEQMLQMCLDNPDDAQERFEDELGHNKT